MFVGMIGTTYCIVRTQLGYDVEIRTLGALLQIAGEFPSEEAAKAWIEQDKRIAEIDERQIPVDPPHIRRTEA